MSDCLIIIADAWERDMPVEKWVARANSVVTSHFLATLLHFFT